MLLAAAVLAPLPALAQQEGDDATAITQVAFLEPGSIANTRDMDFGQIVQPNAAGTVILPAGASPTCTTTGGLVRTGNCRAAEFSIFGRRNWKARLRTVSNTVTLNGPGGATMLMDTVTMTYTGMSPANGANGWNLGRYNIDTNAGVATFWLGGTLHVNAAQAPGVYNGTVVIQIQFN